MRTLIAFLVAITSVAAQATQIPNLICRESIVRFVDPKSLETKEFPSSTIYRTKDGNLYISSADRAEYLYNSIQESEPSRYVSGHKTIQLIRDQSGKINAQITHSYKDEVRVSVAICTSN